VAAGAGAAGRVPGGPVGERLPVLAEAGIAVGVGAAAGPVDLPAVGGGDLVVAGEPVVAGAAGLAGEPAGGGAVFRPGPRWRRPGGCTGTTRPAAWGPLGPLLMRIVGVLARFPALTCRWPQAARLTIPEAATEGSDCPFHSGLLTLQARTVGPVGPIPLA